MITSQQFDNALKIIADYKEQLEIGFFKDSSSIEFQDNLGLEFIDVQKFIRGNMFYVLQQYYKDILNENLEYSDLKKIKISTLEKLDYSQLRKYRGFGKITENNLRELVKSFSSK